MADALKLDEVAKNRGFRRRVEHMLMKRALAVVAEVTPDAAELAVAKLLLATSDASIVDRFSTALVSNTTVANALEANNYEHLALSDAAAEPVVLTVFASYAKAYV